MTLALASVKNKLLRIVKSWIFWLALGISVLAVTGEHYKIPYLTYPYVFLFIGLLPGAVAVAWSKTIAVLFVRFHMFQNLTLSRLWPPNKKKKKPLYVRYREYEEQKPSIWRPVFYTLVNIFGMIYTVLSITHEVLRTNPDQVSNFTSIITLSFLSLMVAAGFNIAAWLLKINGYMFQDKQEGESANLGNVLSNRLAEFFGISAVFSFAYDIYKNSDYHALSAATFILILYTPSLIISYKILEKRHLAKLRRDLDLKLERNVKVG